MRERIKPLVGTKLLLGLSTALIVGVASTVGVAIAQDDVPTAPKMPPTSLDLRSTVTGEKLDFSFAKHEGADTPGLAKFFQTGHDPYIDDKSCLKIGESMFLTSCSGCHGQIGEGKIGPGLNDDYWTYPKNETDQGIFETVYGGATGQMGPHYQDLTLDQMLQVIAWVRHLYKDPVEHAPWLTDEQKKNYKPYKLGEKFGPKPAGQCAVDAAKLGGD